MAGIYILACLIIIVMNLDKLPGVLSSIVTEAFSGSAMAGGVIGALILGMQRAVFSNEAGVGSAAIAHSAAKTDEPIREGMVAMLGPFIDTIVVCTFTALIILSTGIWNRPPDVAFETIPEPVRTESGWQYPEMTLPLGEWQDQEALLFVVEAGSNKTTGQIIHRTSGIVKQTASVFTVTWQPLDSDEQPTIVGDGFYQDHVGATLPAKAFDSVAPGLGKWLITIASWLFAISTIIAWGYYGEQGAMYMMGDRASMPFRFVYCSLTFIACLGHIKTSADLDNMTGIGLGLIIYANLPICWIFGYQAIRAYRDYLQRLKDGRMGPDDSATSIEDLISGKNLQR